MLRNLFKSLNLNKLALPSINSEIRTMHSSSLLSQKSKEKNQEEQDEFDMQLRSQDAKLRNLERLGMIKSSISWPQYNRIIYPPTEDGKPIKNPVKIFLYSILFFET